ncbi:hypothetical protein Tco_0357546 [Tanacetum coccineum]
MPKVAKIKKKKKKSDLEELEVVKQKLKELQGRYDSLLEQHSDLNTLVARLNESMLDLNIRYRDMALKEPSDDTFKQVKEELERRVEVMRTKLEEIDAGKKEMELKMMTSALN